MVKLVCANEKRINFDGLFLNMPVNWAYHINKDGLNIYQDIFGKGALQISFFGSNESSEKLHETAKNHLNRFVSQFNIEAIETTCVEAPKFAIASASGKDEADFLKVWTVVNEQKMLLVTYTSHSKNPELNVAENIVKSIEFEM